MRLLEEGKLHRQVRPGSGTQSSTAKRPAGREFDDVYKAYAQASGRSPDREKFNAMLQSQKEQLRAKYGA